MKLSVIIVNRNTRRQLISCLNSAIDLVRMDDVEFILVDNASTDDSVAAVEKDFPEVKIIRNNGNLGFGKANNIGAKEASGRYLLLLNSDTIVNNEAIIAMIDSLEKSTVIGAVSPQLIRQDSSKQETVAYLPTPYTELFSLARKSARKGLSKLAKSDYVIGSGYYLAGACLMVRTDLFRKIGGFDERFYLYFEDADICRKMLAQGYKLKLREDLYIVHIGGSSSNAVKLGPTVEMLRSRLNYISKYYGGFWMSVLGINIFAGRLRKLIGSFLSFIFSFGKKIESKNGIKVNYIMCIFMLLGMPLRSDKFYKSKICDWQEHVN